jgi:hypothetical protein
MTGIKCCFTCHSDVCKRQFFDHLCNEEFNNWTDMKTGKEETICTLIGFAASSRKAASLSLSSLNNTTLFNGAL